MLLNFRTLRRFYTTKISTYFELFPKTFPNRGPPIDPFIIPAKQLRQEFRTLQSQHHPDILIGAQDHKRGVKDKEDFSSILNKAYTTLTNPYNRIAHFIETHHPQNLDITSDEVSKQLIASLQAQSEQSSLEYKDLLMTVLDVHELLEFATKDQDLEPLSLENNHRITQSQSTLDSLLHESTLDWNKILLEAIRLKYWVNIENGIKDWEPGQPITLTH